MATDPVHPPASSWRHEAGAADPRRATGPRWRREPLRSSGQAPQRARLGRVLGAGASLAVGAGLLLWVFSWLWPLKAANLILLGAGYEENLAFPANVAGWQGLGDLAESIAEQPTAPFGRPGILRLRHGPRRLRVGDAWDRELDACREPTVVLFLALHGGNDSHGGYLLYDDADAQDIPENRLRLEQILDRLARLPAHQNKVLLLDATQMRVNWPLGILHNDFARELEKLGPRIADIPNLVVLGSSAADERSWNSDEWRQTAFTHFLIEGLRGAAADLDRDARVSAWELYQYLGRTVTGWVWSNRQARQTPVLLPAGPLGEQRARAIDLVLARKYQPKPLPAMAPFQPPTELRDAWKRCQQLAEQTPAPDVYTPELWRRYRDWLLRYETLLVSGAPEAAARVANRLASLEQEINRARVIELASARNTLAMPAVIGQITARPSPAVVQHFEQFWTARPSEWNKQWAALQAHVPGGVRVLRMQMFNLLLNRALEAPAANLARARDLATALADPVNPAPAEIHYLMMLSGDLPRPRPPNDLLKHALRSVARGEQAAVAAQDGVYAHSEETYPWVRSAVSEADRQRRLGQDLLFASDAASWDRASAALERAREGYKNAAATGQTIRQAAALRDRALADLPYYSRWVANRASGTNPVAQHDNAAIPKAVDELWRDLHALADALESTPPRADNREAVKQRAVLGDRVRDRFERLATEFAEHCLTLTVANLQVVWRDIDDALIVPTLEPALRMQLLENRQRISRHLLLETGPRVGGIGPLPKIPLTAIRQTASSQSQMALALLGPSWFDQCMGPEQGHFTQAVQRLKTMTGQEKWWLAADQLGAQVGLCYQQMPAEINRQVQRAQQTDGPTARAALAAATRLARLIDSADGERVTSRPAELERRWRLQELLTGQAGRCWEDHWYAADPLAAPYYRTAGLLFVEDAERLAASPQTLPAEVRRQREQLEKPGGLALIGPGRRDVTTEPRFHLQYRLQPTPGADVPPGAPVVWAEAGKHLELLSPLAGSRETCPVGGDRSPAAVRCELSSPLLREAETNPPPLPHVEPTALRLHGLFRGQRISSETRIRLYPLPDVAVYQTPPPTDANLAVRAAPSILRRFGSTNGTVAIVLDCSGSMGPPPGQAFGPNTKYNESLRALQQVLRRLPKGTTISLWTFGQAMGPRKTVTDPNRTVTRVQEPIVWNPEDATQRANLMAKISYPTLEPWNKSPIVRTILSARQDLRQAPGFKSILVLTDSMDNTFAHDKELNPHQLPIPVYLTQAFRDSGIVLNIISYKPTGEEQKEAEAQFKVVEKLPLPGKFVRVDDAKALAGTLELALRQSLRYWIDTEDNVPLPPPGGVDMTPLDANDRWYPGGLTPGTYKLRTQTDRLLTRNITLDRGDLLSIDLLSAEGGPRFERALYGPSAFPWKPAIDRSGWRLAVLQNQTVADSGLEMLIALEKTYDRREDVLQMLKPRQTWIEVGPPADTTGTYAQRWGYHYGYPAPCWSLRVPRWLTPSGGPARPRIRVWWNPDQETPPATSLERGADFQAPTDIRDRAVLVDGEETRIARVAVEPHVVEVRPGVRESRSCLTIRVRHAAGKPVWARVEGLTPAGHEHHFYTEAAQYTGLFWPVTADQAEGLLRRVSLISRSAFQRDAERRGYTVDLRDLPPPAPNDVRPRPLANGN